MRAPLRSIFVIAFALLSLPAVLALQQTPPARRTVVPTGTGAIGGVVTSPTGSGEERPVRRVIVWLLSNDLRGSREAATDDLGRFVFTELPARALHAHDDQARLPGDGARREAISGRRYASDAGRRAARAGFEDFAATRRCHRRHDQGRGRAADRQCRRRCPSAHDRRRSGDAGAVWRRCDGRSRRVPRASGSPPGRSSSA